METNRKIAFIHMLNNFSGSPNVLSTVAEQFFNCGITTSVITSFNNDGFLCGIPATKKINVSYTFRNNIVSRTLELLKFQIQAACKVIALPKNEIIYINTILPFLPAVAGKLTGKKIIYHIHEAYPEKGIFQNICFWCAEKTSDKIICVSEYVKNNLSEAAKLKAVVVYNALGKNFLEGGIPKIPHPKKNLLMVSSAREYKGIFEFCKLAEAIPNYNFTLVCDATEKEIESLFSSVNLQLENLKIFPTQKNLHPFYAKADLVLNLSNPKMITETFGLTILEGMHYGLPAIVPPVGGIAELVHEGKNGMRIDVNNMDELKAGVLAILENEEKYAEMATAALENSKKFNPESQINSIFNEVF